MSSIFDKCINYTAANKLREADIYPYFQPIEGYRGTKVIMGGKEFIMAGSNNYLGLAWDPRVKEAAIAAIETYGASCCGSRFMNGTLVLHEQLEERLADFVGKESALCMTTGYQTNLGSISALVRQKEHIISDRLNHASIVDGIFMATGLSRNIIFHRYRHNDMDDLDRVLAKIRMDEPKMVATDGVFSMEGDIVKLPELKAVADKYNAKVYLDEAHALGVIGKTGRGTQEHFGEVDLADVIMSTFSKAFGSMGGFVASDYEVIDYIKHTSRPLMFSASIPPANIAAVMKSIEIIESEPDRLVRLHEISQKMKKGFDILGFDTGNTETPIVPLVIGGVEKTLKFHSKLLANGVYTNPVIAPAVPSNRSMIRTSFMATHTDEELNRILDVSGDVGRELGII